MSPTSRGVRVAKFCLLATLVALSANAALEPGEVYDLTFRDVDGNALSTRDGKGTIITVITRHDETSAQAVADLVPDRYIGDPNFRYITLVNFQRKLIRPIWGLTRTIIRSRLDAVAEKRRPLYRTKQIARDPRADVHVVADFDGSAVNQLGLTPEADRVAVFVFDGQGKLRARWDEVPPGDELPKTLAAIEEAMRAQ